ncbi:MAG: sigma-70 family RNA polymerase sigma factor [Rhodocyclaceae bacterium]|nr:MAG: sigma-70 family RNA polymerase sigma factor [Rhodocyclaceae bacterium]
MHSRDAIVAEIPRLRRYAHALLGEANRADDLVQDTLERALSRWRLWQPLGGQGTPRAWLFAIMHNLFINQLKAGKAIDYRPDDEVPDLPTRPTQEDALGLRDLTRALATLPGDQREILLLIGLEELSYREAAKVLGVPLGTVMSRLSRARARLRGVLDEEAGGGILKVIK